MPSARAFSSLFVLLGGFCAVGTMGTGCLMNLVGTGEEATLGTGGAGGTSQSTGGRGGEPNTGTGGIEIGGGGATAGGGGTGGMNTGGSGGAGGAGGGPIVDADACPGVGVSIMLNQKVVVGSDTSTKIDDYSVPVCGGSSAPDVVVAITPEDDGILTVAVDPLTPFQPFVYARSACDGDGAAPCSDDGLILDATAGTTVFVFVDGHPDESGEFFLRLSLTATHCGNGVLEGAFTEECDDGNAVAGDGCDACKMECTCTGCSNTDVYYNTLTHHCYVQGYDNKSWNDARAACQSWGGDLAGIGTLEEYNGLVDLLDNNGEDAWLGGRRVAPGGAFMWVNGELWQDAQIPWNGGEPNNSGGSEECVEVIGTLAINGDTKYNDSACNAGNNFLCERAPAGVIWP